MWETQLAAPLGGGGGGGGGACSFSFLSAPGRAVVLNTCFYSFSAELLGFNASCLSDFLQQSMGGSFAIGFAIPFRQQLFGRQWLNKKLLVHGQRLPFSLLLFSLFFVKQTLKDAHFCL